MLHLEDEACSVMPLAAEEMRPRPDLALLDREGIVSKPPHPIFVIEPIFIGVGIGRRGDDRVDLAGE